MKRYFPHLLLSVLGLLLASHAGATDYTFEFTGLGSNGTTASGTFTLDNPAFFAPGYVGDSTIFKAFSVTFSNVPFPDGPSSFTLQKTPDGSPVGNYFVDNAGTIYVGPSGTYHFDGSNGGPDYVLNVNNPGPSDPQELLTGNLIANTFSTQFVDTITWSPAIAAVPEPSTWFGAALTASLIAGGCARRLRKRV